MKKPNAKIKYYPVVLRCQDGCQLLMHGKKYEADWTVSFPSGVKATCPHGFSVEAGTGTEHDVLILSKSFA